MKAVLVPIFVIGVLVGGCNKSRQPTATVILLDTSASIERASFENAIDLIGKLAGKMKRGDRLSVIPISTNTEREVQGRIIRMELPLDRQTYDVDLRRKSAGLQTGMASLRKAGMNPSGHTDILGALRVAQQELTLSRDSAWRVIILSAFFKTMPVLGSP